MELLQKCFQKFEREKVIAIIKYFHDTYPELLQQISQSGYCFKLEAQPVPAHSQTDEHHLQLNLQLNDFNIYNLTLILKCI